MRPQVIAKRVQDARASGKPNAPVFVTRISKHGEPFLIRYGVVYDEPHFTTQRTPFYVAIGTSLEPNAKILAGFTWIYRRRIPGVRDSRVGDGLDRRGPRATPGARRGAERRNAFRDRT